MRKSRYSDQQIALALQQVAHGAPVAEVCRKLGVTEQTYYRWKKKFGEMAPSEIKKLKQLEDENRRLKGLVAELTLDKQMLHEVLRKKD
jgi:putative transposase